MAVPRSRGAPCMDHIRGAHDVPWEIKSLSLEKYLPPWTVTRQVCSDSLAAQHWGNSTDVLLLSDKIHKRGLPHIAFRRSYALCCRCRQSRRWLGWYSLTPPAQVRCVRLGPRRSWIDIIGRPDVPLSVGDRCGLCSRPW